MITYVTDFLGYMIFSSLEYFAIYFLICSLFSLYPYQYKKELVILTGSTTLISYLLVVSQIYNVIPAPFISIPTIWLLLKLTLKQRWTFTFVISTIGFILSGLIQTAIIGIFMNLDYINSSNLADSFTHKTYFLQTINAITICAIALVIGLTKSGFGFSFRKGSSRGFIFISIVLLCAVGLSFDALYLHKNSNAVFLLFGGVILASSLILYYFSYKRDNFEYK